MIAGLNVITDNLDYLLWGRAAAGEPGGIALVTDGAGAADRTARRYCPRVPGLAFPGSYAALFLWAELIRGIPLIFVIFWMWYLLPLITGAICRVR
jgi:polar amino acid transport system permease protein